MRFESYIPGSANYERLALAASLMTAFSKHGYSYYVDDTWFDHGAGLKWTTILCDVGGHSVQVCSPRDQESLLVASGPAHLGAIIEEMWADKYSVEK